MAGFPASRSTDWIVGNIRNCLNIVTPGLEWGLLLDVLNADQYTYVGADSLGLNAHLLAPDIGWVKLNCDGVIYPISNEASHTGSPWSLLRLILPMITCINSSLKASIALWVISIIGELCNRQ
ncbi:hypothetical protein J1N35_020458 [Gossypium stocksii]|uniref:Uncharacterized protein n=1 Tax=Gossypium stocksii TaxID=47602 RepID=A0A9D3VEL1_9ROSI|nr:hypothetical protein J1N35_020458 [Gossypium stocksii]